MLYTKFRGNRPVGSGEEDFDRFLPYRGVCMYTTLGQDMCLLTFRSLAAIISEKSTVFTFSYRKAQVTRFDLAVK